MAFWLSIALLAVNAQIDEASERPQPTAERPEDQPDRSKFRRWANAAGDHEAVAALVEARGDTIWLCNANGKLARVRRSDLSEADRRYVDQQTGVEKRSLVQTGRQVPVPKAATDLLMRTWTDASGTHRQRAAVLAVRGDNIWFRKSNGRLAVARLGELSAMDRQYALARQRFAGVDLRLATRQSQPAEPAKVPANKPNEQQQQPSKPLLEEAIENVEASVGQMFERMRSPEAQKEAAGKPASPAAELAAEAPTMLPATLVYVQVSRNLLQHFIDQRIETDSVVTDSILGTSITGQAHTSGVTDAVLKDNPNEAAADIDFRGTIHSHTLGYNGPVILHSAAQTRFHARKQLTLSSAGLRIAAATATAQTHSTTRYIESSLPGLRGRIAERIAWQRAGEMHAEADAIAGQHAAARINQALDERIERSVAVLRSELSIHVSRLPYDHDRVPPLVRFSSTPTHLCVVIQRSEAKLDEWRIQPPPIEGSPDLVVRVHRAALGRAREAFGRLLSQVLRQRAEQRQVLTAVGDGEEPPALDLRWSLDRQWLTVEYSTAASQPLPLAAGNASAHR